MNTTTSIIYKRGSEGKPRIGRGRSRGGRYQTTLLILVYFWGCIGPKMRSGGGSGNDQSRKTTGSVCNVVKRDDTTVVVRSCSSTTAAAAAAAAASEGPKWVHRDDKVIKFPAVLINC
ncbi:unnamed protein product [Onchocerca flexuosa]|uniref:Uncharacterized protein n=1 Tax=Onchocerca flexuosa TaxID=387005 RepID=A0A183H531_9BILA|nr:unnamed protein product [Onchocerca flexuosa]